MIDRATRTPPHRVRVWDLAVRAFHWGLVLLVAGAFLTGEEDDWNLVHVRIGLAIVGLVAFRVVWGLVGTRHARFADFVKRPREVIEYANAYVRGRPPLHLGHNPLGATMVLALLATIAGLGATGVVMRLGPEWEGPLTPYLTRSVAHGISELHEGLAGALLVLAGLHVAGVLLSSWIERQNLVAGMITGFKRSDTPVDEPVMSAGRRVAALAVAVLTAIAVVVTLGRLFPEASASAAETPRSTLERFDAEARADSPGFAGFDAARGRALYTSVHGPDRESCTTCHTADPTARGKSPAGKVVEPLAPSANPARFTDRRETDKWFDRNCKQVLGRPCTATEKGDLITWLMTL
ncbi:DUF1924 domain-containing protein [Myxococcota bacterium]|nr:DUF1924 domain-containing protein [Myxococcota bacterium]